MLLLLYVSLSNYNKIQNFMVGFASTKPVQYSCMVSSILRSLNSEYFYYAFTESKEVRYIY
jgi:hypothetical protein